MKHTFNVKQVEEMVAVQIEPLEWIGQPRYGAAFQMGGVTLTVEEALELAGRLSQAAEETTR